jgi:hypothetical protein
MIFKYIVAKYFFQDYAPTVMNWRNKMAKKSGRGKPLDFSEEDNKAIKKGLQQLFKDLQH